MNKDIFCPDDCKFLNHNVLHGGYCMALSAKKLRDYDINAVLVKYIKDEKCPLKNPPD